MKNSARQLEYGVRMRICDKNAAISENIQTRTCCTVTVRALRTFLQSLDVIALQVRHSVPSSI